jgi:hypothetical protein
MNDITRVLSVIEHGDALAAERLLPVVYEELHRLVAPKMLQEVPDQTLQFVAPMHEAYLRRAVS